MHIVRFMHYINRLYALTKYKLGGHMEKIKETISKIKVFQPAVFRVDNYIQHHLNAAMQRPGQCLYFEIFSNQSNFHIEYIVKLYWLFQH
jgi:hypothetical protein